MRALYPLVLAIPLAYAFERLMPIFGLSGSMRALRFVVSASLWLAIYGLLTAPLMRGIGLRALLSEFRWPGAAPRTDVPRTEVPLGE